MQTMRSSRLAIATTIGLTFSLSVPAGAQTAPAEEAGHQAFLFNDSHFHLTNYVMAGPTLEEYLGMMANTVRRSTVFGLPLQQMWDYDNTGDYAPTYYLQTDAPLYYYSFVDAMIAQGYRALTPEQQARLDPMIVGFNPADMYAVDHVRRVLLAFPGVFTGIGEFSIHKEFVSAKTAGGPTSLTDQSLHRLLDFAAEVGLVTIIHQDIDVPFPRPNQDPYNVTQFRDLVQAHPNATIIWAHIGLGRVVTPPTGMIGMIDRALANPSLRHLYVDLSWGETAKYITATPEGLRMTADLVNRYPDRFLFGSDEVAPQSLNAALAVYNTYQPLWDLLTPEAKQLVLFGNYDRIFDNARQRVRAWERANGARPELTMQP